MTAGALLKAGRKAILTVNPIRNPPKIVVNPMPNPALKLPTASKLKSVLGTYEFHAKNGQLKWSTKKPAGEVIRSVQVTKVSAGRTGNSITAHFLKSDQTKVYFSKGGSSAPHYFGPVSWTTLPKSAPPTGWRG